MDTTVAKQNRFIMIGCYFLMFTLAALSLIHI